MKAKTIRILLPFAGFLLGCLFIIILVLNFAYRDAAPIIPPLFKTIHSRPLKSTHLRDIARKQCPADFFNK